MSLDGKISTSLRLFAFCEEKRLTSQGASLLKTSDQCAVDSSVEGGANAGDGGCLSVLLNVHLCTVSHCVHLLVGFHESWILSLA